MKYFKVLRWVFNGIFTRNKIMFVFQNANNINLASEVFNEIFQKALRNPHETLHFRFLIKNLKCVTDPWCCPRSRQCCCRPGCHDWHPRHWKVCPAYFLPPNPSSQRSSGAHVNPQVSVAFALTGDLAPHSLPAYLLGQFLGAGAAALLVCLLYLDVLWQPGSLAAMASSPGVTQSTFPLVSVDF